MFKLEIENSLSCLIQSQSSLTLYASCKLNLHFSVNSFTFILSKMNIALKKKCLKKKNSFSLTESLLFNSFCDYSHSCTWIITWKIWQYYMNDSVFWKKIMLKSLMILCLKMKKSNLFLFNKITISCWFGKRIIICTWVTVSASIQSPLKSSGYLTHIWLQQLE